MRALLLAVPLALLLAACGGKDSSCPNPPDCTKGKLCGCACIEASKKCTKAMEEASLLAAEDE